MIKPKLSLRNFFQKQAENEETVTVETDTETTETESDERTDDDQSDEDEHQEETTETETDDSAEQQPDAEATEMVNAAELTQLRTKAGNWDNVQAELTQLRTWYATQTTGGKLPKADVSDQRVTSQKSWEKAPWNQ